MKTLLNELLANQALSAKDPDIYLKIMNKQFQVMKSWTEPLLKTMHRQGADLNKLANHFHHIQEGYQDVLSRADEERQTFAKFKAALEIDPYDDGIYYKRGLFWYNRGKMRQALSDFKNALDLKPKNKKYQRIVAHLQGELKKGKIEEQTL